MRRAPLLACLLACLSVCLTACDRPDPSPQRYYDKQYLFSFIPPKGWSVTTTRTSACLTSVEASQGDCQLYVCVSERPEEFLPTTSDFANCELVKAYVAERLKGYNIRCRPTLVQGRRGYDAIYLRNVADDHGGARYQLVRQTFLSRGKLLYTFTFYVFGDSPQELKEVSTPCDDPILRSLATFFLHAVPKEGVETASGGQRATPFGNP